VEIASAPTVEAAIAAPPKRRIHRRRLVGVIVGIVLAVVVVSELYLETSYMPLTQGSSVGPDIDTPGSLFVAAQSSPMDQGSLWTWCYTPGRTFAWYISLRNNGPLPVTILGSGQGGPPAVFYLVDFAQLRQGLPDNTPTLTHEIITNSATAPVLPATTLAADDEIEVWARFKIGDVPLDSGATEWTQTLSVRYSVLGIERTVDVPLRDGVGVDGSPCPPRSWP
jgi:hypothetical protein